MKKDHIQHSEKARTTMAETSFIFIYSYGYHHEPNEEFYHKVQIMAIDVDDAINKFHEKLPELLPENYRWWDMDSITQAEDGPHLLEVCSECGNDSHFHGIFVDSGSVYQTTCLECSHKWKRPYTHFYENVESGGKSFRRE